MKSKKRNKYLLLLILLLAVTVGYAALSTTLKINGTAKLKKNTWNVYWENAVVTDGSKGNTTPTISQDVNEQENTKISWNVTLDLPGDYYEFTVDAVNMGTIDAMITNISSKVNGGDVSTLPSYIKYTVTYADGVGVAKYDKLKKKEDYYYDRETHELIQNKKWPATYRVRVEFLDTITVAELNAIPTGGLSYDFTYEVTYSPADSNAKEKSVYALPYGKTANTLALGDEVCVKNQCFYFIKYDGDDAILFAKWNLNVGNYAKGNTETFLQENGITSGDGCYMDDYGCVAFSGSKYWDDNGTLKSDYEGEYQNINNLPYVYDSNYRGPMAPNGSVSAEYGIAYYVEQYKSLLLSSPYNARLKEVRLLSYSELVNDIRPYNSGIVSSTMFWTGSAYNSSLVMYNSPSGMMNPGSMRFGVRPVIVVEKSNL